MSRFEMPWTDGRADYIVEVSVTGRYIPATYWEPAECPDICVESVRLDDAYGRRSKRGLQDWHKHAPELQRDAEIAAQEWERDARSWRQPEGYEYD